MVLRSRVPRRARIEIIPMIDVVFFLLVFFMMASLAMTIYQGLPVNLPEAASGQKNNAETASITLSATAAASSTASQSRSGRWAAASGRCS